MVVISKCNTFAKQNKNIMKDNHNPNDRQKALDLANKLEFEDFDVSALTNEGNYDHMKVWFLLFADDIGGAWTIDGTYYGKYKLSYESERIESVSKELEDELDIFIEDYRNSDEKAQHDEESFRDHQEEMLRNTNRNHF